MAEHISSGSGVAHPLIVNPDGSINISGTIAANDAPLTTGSYVTVSLGSNVWTRVAPISNTEAWAVSISGGEVRWQVSGFSQTNMVNVAHTFPAAVPLYAEDTRPSNIMIKAETDTSGTVVMYAQ